MKKLLFLLLSAAVAVSASAGVNTLKMKQTAQNPQKNAVEKMFRTSDRMMPAAPATISKAFAKADIPEGYAMVTLSAGDIWSDGSGYQMLLDADATAYGTLIPETGGLTTDGDASDDLYAQFEYKIPENADGYLATTNIVFDEEVSILVPAGVYDYCITNPTPGDRMWISSDQGPCPGRGDDFEFVEGLTYVFTIGIYGTNDGVALTVLEPGIALTLPENVTVAPGDTYANVSWEDTDDNMWNLRYRPYTDMSQGSFSCDLNNEDVDALIATLGDWIIYDVDGDGDYWGIGYGVEGAAPDYCFQSDSYYNGTAYDPDQYLISPEVNLGGVLRFTMWGTANWPDNIKVYVIPDLENITSLDDLAQYPLTDDLSTPGSATDFEYSLSAWEGTTGRIAFRHYNCPDCYYVKIDNIFIGDPNAPIVEPAPWTVVEGLTETNYTIEGLTPETEYEVQVQAAGLYSTTDWTPNLRFFTTAEATNVYILGEVNDLDWAANNGLKMDFDAENNVYTATVTLDGRGESGENYFSFTTRLANDDDAGGWAYITPFRFGAVSDGDFWFDDMYLGQPLALTYENGQAFRVMGGEYTLTLSLEDMTLIINKEVVEDHRGDFNMDGLVNTSDVSTLIGMLLNGITPPMEADCNGDNMINTSDLASLITYLLNQQWPE